MINKYVSFLFLIPITIPSTNCCIYWNSSYFNFLCNFSLFVRVALLYRYVYSPINVINHWMLRSVYTRGEHELFNSTLSVCYYSDNSRRCRPTTYQTILNDLFYTWYRFVYNFKMYSSWSLNVQAYYFEYEKPSRELWKWAVDR